MADITINSPIAQYLPQSFFDDKGKLTVPEKQATDFAQGIMARVDHLPSTQRALFLAGVQGLDISPTSKIGDKNVDATLNRLESITNTIATIMMSSSIDLLARLMIENAAMDRKNALQERLSAYSNAKLMLEGQAGKMREAADKMIEGAIVQLAMTVVASAITIVASGMSMKAGGKALQAGMDEAKETVKSVAKEFKAAAGKFSNDAQNFSQLGQGISGIANAVGNFYSQFAQAQAKKLEADGSMMAATAENLKTQADLRKEIQQALEQLVSAIINFLKELKDAQANQMQSLTRI